MATPQSIFATSAPETQRGNRDKVGGNPEPIVRNGVTWGPYKWPKLHGERGSFNPNSAEKFHLT